MKPLELLVRIILFSVLYFAGLCILEVPPLPWTSWVPGSLFLGIGFVILLGSSRRKS